MNKKKPGVIYKLSNPEFAGQIPTHQDIEVLPEDQKASKIGWTVQEFVGPEVHFPNQTKETITDKKSLQEGAKIWVPHVMGGYIPMTVKEDDYGELYGESECHIAVLKFGYDSRNCWSMLSLINKNAIKFIKTQKEINNAKKKF
jgi:hypothetical protein